MAATTAAPRSRIVVDGGFAGLDNECCDTPICPLRRAEGGFRAEPGGGPASAIYFLVVLPVNKLSEELNPHHDLTKAKRACPECLTQIPAMASRCSACTAQVQPILDQDSGKLIESTPGEIELSGTLSLKPVGAAVKSE